jgi:streptogramin lyase
MRKLALIGLLACLAAGSPPADGYSYVVLNHSTYPSLVRIGADGKYLSTIANGFQGHSLARAANGDYLVDTIDSLLRVTPSGTVTTFAKAPMGSHWLQVMQAPNGNVIVNDNVRHALWSISPDGESIVKIANYPIANEHEQDSANLALDPQGNYMLLDFAHPAARFFRFTPSGAVTEIPLSKPIVEVLGLLSEGTGSYLAQEGRGNAIIRIAATGEITDLVRFNLPWGNIPCMVHDPATGDIIAVNNHNNRIMRISPDGKKITTFSISSIYFRDPLAIVVDTEQ